MAVYASTVTLNQNVSKNVGIGVRIIAGTVNVTNYNPTLAEITDISKHFRGNYVVLLGGVSDEGFLVAWDATNKAVKAWYPTAFRTGSTAAADSTSGALAEDNAAAETVVRLMDTAIDTTYPLANLEVIADVDVGAVQFVAVGTR